MTIADGDPAETGDVWSEASGFRTDVIYTPKPGDGAHADFVAFGTPTSS